MFCGDSLNREDKSVSPVNRLAEKRAESRVVLFNLIISEICSYVPATVLGLVTQFMIDSSLCLLSSVAKIRSRAHWMRYATAREEEPRKAPRCGEKNRGVFIWAMHNYAHRSRPLHRVSFLLGVCGSVPIHSAQ